MCLSAFNSHRVSKPEVLLVPQVSEEFLFHSVTPELREVGNNGSEGLAEWIELSLWQHGTAPQQGTDIGYGGQFSPQLGPAGL